MGRDDRRLRSAFFVFALTASWPTFAGTGLSLAVATNDDYIFVDSFESSDCSQPLTCTTPVSGKACIAGQLTDAATTQPLHATFNVGLACGHGAIGGPCDLSLTTYDALQFESSPGTSTPLPSGAIILDGCGRFRVSDLTPPVAGFVAIVADDALGGDGHVPSATLRALAANQQVNGIDASVATTATVSTWSLVGQADFSSGATLLKYTTSGTPAAGVVATRDGGSSGATFRYFTDTDGQRMLVSPSATSTGTNGSVLIANGALGTYSGTKTGLSCSSVNTLTISGVFLSAELVCSP